MGTSTNCGHGELLVKIHADLIMRSEDGVVDLRAGLWDQLKSAIKKFKVHSYRKHEGCPPYVLWGALNEDRARRNHGQSLERLNQRGGLSPREIVANVLDADYADLELDAAQVLDEIRKIAAAI